MSAKEVPDYSHKFSVNLRPVNTGPVLAEGDGVCLYTRMADIEKDEMPLTMVEPGQRCARDQARVPAGVMFEWQEIILHRSDNVDRYRH